MVEDFFLHNKAVFALAGVFLAVAFVVPLVYFTLAGGPLGNIVIQNPTGMETGGNVTVFPSPQQADQSRISLTIVLVVVVVFVSLFIVAMYIGINHVHPSHKKPAKEPR
ncbi:MAG: hypothetical protein NWE93_04210 [Candidatus Bathyarchaeota archaeon]|nr:hypothetical protein [Candidatus Bathyarchaeota archaeon]